MDLEETLEVSEVVLEEETDTTAEVQKAENKKTINRKWILVACLAVVLVLAVSLWYYLIAGNITRKLTVEAGTAVTAEDFKVIDVDANVGFSADMAAFDTTLPGEYPVVVEYNDHSRNSTLVVVDTVAPVLNIKDVVAFSTQEPEPEDFIESVEDGSLVFYAFDKAPDMTLKGEQDVRILAIDLGGNITAADAKLSVLFDDVAPTLVGVKDIQQYVGWDIDYMDGVMVYDNLDTSVDIDVDYSEVNTTVGGEYTVHYVVTDTSNNQSVKDATVTIIDDTQGPQILGVNKLSIYQGSSMSYRSGVIVTDDYAENPVLSIDSSQVNLTEPGTYTVIYSAKDDVGNETVFETTLTVKKQPSSYVDESVVFAKADEILAKIITDDMTTKEQVEAIAKWFRSNCSYVSYSDKTDRIQAAYQMMTRRYGDCYSYFAACSVMLERLDIPQINVERSRNSVRRTRHYWSLVSLDGGETYYHLDVSPHYSFSIKTILVTDATLKRCNRYVPGYYTMETGLYPATPESAPE